MKLLTQDQLRDSVGIGASEVGVVRNYGRDAQGKFIRIPFADRFWLHVEKTATCWLWTGYVRPDGYATFTIGPGRNEYVHRVSYLLTYKRPVPFGYEIDHACGKRHCVNPEHLRVVTSQENTLRNSGPSAVNALKTHCKNGHPLTPENLLNVSRKRLCKICNRARWQRLDRKR